MKSIILGLTLLFAASASAYTTGGHVHFQKGSTYVNALYNKTLCLNSDGTYQATVSTCLKWENAGDDDRVCVKRGKKTLYQAKASTRMRCARMAGDKCVEYVRVDYNQSRTRNVNVYNNSDDFQYSKKVTIPSCN